MSLDRTIDLSEANTRIGAEADRVWRVGLGVGVIGMLLAALWAVFFVESPVVRFSKAYMVSYIFVLSIALGGLFFVFVQHLTRAGWSVAVRRPAEAFAANLAWLWVFFLPILLLLVTGRMGEIFHWADLHHLEELGPAGVAEAHLIAKKSAYLNVGFFLIRAVIYFVAWALLGLIFWRASTRQDASGDVRITERLQTLAAPTAIIFGITITFAAFDWMMSLNPTWFSTMFGVYFFAACCTSGFAALIVTCVILQRAGRLRGIITTEHYHDLGKLLFAFGMVFWAYIAFSQYMLIWYANLPEETTFFLARQAGAWVWFSLALLFGHFAIPFLLLLSRHPKRSHFLVIGAIWMAFFAWLDLYWLIMPELPIGFLPELNSYNEFTELTRDVTTNLLSPLNWLLLASFLGFFAAFTARNLRGNLLVPARDPRLKESLAFENM